MLPQNVPEFLVIAVMSQTTEPMDTARISENGVHFIKADQNSKYRAYNVH